MKDWNKATKAERQTESNSRGVFILWFSHNTRVLPVTPRVRLLHGTMSRRDPRVSPVPSVIFFHFSFKHCGIKSIKKSSTTRWCIAEIWAVNCDIFTVLIIRFLYLFPPACGCSAAGTSAHVNECHPQTGSCQCLGHVTGRDCSYCEVGFFNLQPGVGCER